MSETARLLDKTSPIPLYYQLFLRMRADIQAGIVRPGDLLGTEKDIQERYGVSRSTVRKALDELGRTGQLVRVTGRGTFVAEPPLNVHMPHLLSLTEELNRRGIVPGGRVLAFERIEAPTAAADALGCRRTERVLHIRRLRTGDGTPIVLVDHYLAPSITLGQNSLRESLYGTLESVLGIRLQEAYHTVRAVASRREEAEMLAMKVGDAVLRFERTTLDATGRPVVYETGSGRGDRYDYSVHLFRK
ncbi:MAG TPA: GntR family transcriptional regulator [Chloroflexota bacterium]